MATRDSDRLKLVISTETISAGQLSALISAFDGSFNAFVRRRSSGGDKPRLAVSAVEHGSIELLFDAVDGLKKVIDAGKYLAPWAPHLADLANWYLFAMPPKLSPADRKVVEAVSNTIVSDNATQITLNNYGTVILNVGQSEASGMQEALGARRRTSERRSTVPTPAPRLLDDRQVDLLKSGELLGTAYYVAGSWFARLETGYGVLVPIRLQGTTIELEDGSAYRFRGNVEHGPRGETIGVSLSGADPLI